ncbi:MAG: hypothetical protein IIB15_00870, partial [Chloroflexi bacterium]|nr:hypothetical protein [Chloroflexota bacterium]
AMKQAAELFDRLNTLPGVNVRTFEHGSNIFPIEFGSDVDVERFVSALRERDVFIHPHEADPDRYLLHVNTTILRQSNDTLFEAFKDALG